MMAPAAVEIKNGKRKSALRKIFPGYVMIKMVMTDESWYIVRNTRGVTGFVGPDSKPVALTDDEVELLNGRRKHSPIAMSMKMHKSESTIHRLQRSIIEKIG